MADLGIQLRSASEFESKPNRFQTSPVYLLPSLAGFATLLILRSLTETTVAPLVQIFALALVISSPLAFIGTRYAAEKSALGHEREIFPAAIGGLFLCALLSGSAGMLYFTYAAPQSWLLKTIAVPALIYTSMNVVALSFPAAMRRFRALALMMIGSLSLSVIAGWFGFQTMQMPGLVAGFAVGQVVLFILLIRLIHFEFGRGDGSLATWELPVFRKPSLHLAICGLCLPLGLWVDKILPFPAASDWHLTAFAMLFSLPGIISFFLHLRTDFSPALSNFNNATACGSTLLTLRHAKVEVTRAFNSGFTQLVITQLIITAIAAFYAPNIGSFLNYSAEEVSSFQVALVGMFLAVLFFSLLAVLYFLSDYKGAPLPSVAFAVIHIAMFSATSFRMEAWHGFGFVIASGIAMLLAVFRVNRNLARLEYRLIEG